MVAQWIVFSRNPVLAPGHGFMHFVSRVVDEVTRYAGRLDRQEWVYVSVGVLILGLITLRGFGSRTNY